MQVTQQIVIRFATLLVFIAAAWIHVHRMVVVPLTFYETSADLQTAPTMPLSERALDVLTNAFPQKAYFAAFAAHADGRFGWVGGRHSAADARREALERCNRGGSGCEIQSTIFPEKYDPHFGGNTVSQRAVAKNIARFIPRGSIWYALSPDGAWGVQAAGAFPPLQAWRRCEKFLKGKVRPAYYSRNGCRLYYGPMYAVSK